MKGRYPVVNADATSLASTTPNRPFINDGMMAYFDLVVKDTKHDRRGIRPNGGKGGMEEVTLLLSSHLGVSGRRRSGCL